MSAKADARRGGMQEQNGKQDGGLVRARHNRANPVSSKNKKRIQ